MTNIVVKMLSVNVNTIYQFLTINAVYSAIPKEDHNIYKHFEPNSTLALNNEIKNSCAK